MESEVGTEQKRRCKIIETAIIHQGDREYSTLTIIHLTSTVKVEAS